MSTALIKTAQKKMQQGQVLSLTKEEINGLIEAVNFLLEQEEKKDFEQKLRELPKRKATPEEEESIQKGRKDIEEGSYIAKKANDSRSIVKILREAEEKFDLG